MRELTLKAGVDECVYDKLLEVDLQITEKEIERKLKFLNAVRPLYLRVKHVYDLVPPHAWDNYRMFGFKNLAEQQELNKARRLLCNKWNRRYGKKTPKDNDKKTDPEHSELEQLDHSS